MSARVKLATVLPGESEVNGLDELQTALVDALDSETGVVVIAVLDVAAVTHAAGTDPVPRVRVRKVEAVGWIGEELPGLPACPDSVRQAFLDRSEERRGMAPLPMEALTAEDDFDVIE